MLSITTHIIKKYIYLFMLRGFVIYYYYFLRGCVTCACMPACGRGESGEGGDCETAQTANHADTKGEEGGEGGVRTWPLLLPLNPPTQPTTTPPPHFFTTQPTPPFFTNPHLQKKDSLSFLFNPIFSSPICRSQLLYFNPSSFASL
jgi:hypothetical protein